MKRAVGPPNSASQAPITEGYIALTAAALSKILGIDKVGLEKTQVVRLIHNFSSPFELIPCTPLTWVASYETKTALGTSELISYSVYDLVDLEIVETNSERSTTIVVKDLIFEVDLKGSPCRHLQLPTHLRKTLPVKVTFGSRSQFQFMCWPSLLSLFVFGGGGGCQEELRSLIYVFSSLWCVPWAIKRWIDAKRNGSCVQGSRKYSDALVRKFSSDISSMLTVARHPEMGTRSPCSLSWTWEDSWISEGKGNRIKRRMGCWLIQYFYLYQIFYKTLVGTTKMSFVFLYLDLFPIPTFKIVCQVVNASILAAMIAFVGATIFQCTPIPFFWDRTIPHGHCISTAAFWYGHAAWNTAVDIIVLLLPIPVIRSLQMGNNQKFAVLGVFGLGAL
jgi:hypothetical protein